jgi:hypothetical protein
MSSSSVIMVCGEDLFHSWALQAILHDVLEEPEAEEYQHRLHQLGDWGRRKPSFHFEMIDWDEAPTRFSIWTHVYVFSGHYCSDPRDRVFGLLALADSKSRKAFSPDYTKSATVILLQLIKYQAEEHDAWRPIHEIEFTHTRDVVGTFGFDSDNSDIAAMRDRRRTAIYGEEPFPGRNKWLPSIRENDPRHPRGLPSRLLSDLGSNHVVVEARFHYTVWRNDATEFVVHLYGTRDPLQPVLHDFSTEQGGTADDGIRLHTPEGLVIGLANKQIRPGDTILLFGKIDSHDSDFPTGLIVRRYREWGRFVVATIVGQCIFDSDFGTYEGRRNYRMCSPSPRVSDKEAWKVLMSPEDRLVFIAQDLNQVYRQPKKFKVPMIDISVQLEESKKRLTTRVTSEDFSSYAIAAPIT